MSKLVAGNLIKESKIIILDLGRSLSKFEVSMQGTDQLSADLTLREKMVKFQVVLKN